MPPALKSRFTGSSIIEIPLPTEKQRYKVLKHYFKKNTHDLSKSFIRHIAKITHGYSQRELEKFVRSVCIKVDLREAEKIEAQDCEEVLKELGLNYWNRYFSLSEESKKNIGIFFRYGMPILANIVQNAFHFYCQRHFTMQQLAFSQRAHREQLELTKSLHNDQYSLWNIVGYPSIRSTISGIIGGAAGAATSLATHAAVYKAVECGMLPASCTIL